MGPILTEIGIITQFKGYYSEGTRSKDTGKPDNFLEANQLILQGIETNIIGKVSLSCRITGNVSVGDGTIIKENTTVKGPAIIATAAK